MNEAILNLEDFLDQAQVYVDKRVTYRQSFELTTSHKGSDLCISNSGGGDFVDGLISISWRRRKVRIPEGDSLYAHAMKLVS